MTLNPARTAVCDVPGCDASQLIERGLYADTELRNMGWWVQRTDGPDGFTNQPGTLCPAHAKTDYLDVPGHMRVHIAQLAAEKLADTYTRDALREMVRVRGLRAGRTKHETAWELVTVPDPRERCIVCGTTPCRFART